MSLKFWLGCIERGKGASTTGLLDGGIRLRLVAGETPFTRIGGNSGVRLLWQRGGYEEVGFNISTRK